MTTKNFRDLLNRRQKLLYRKAILSELADHLTKFLDTDAIPTKMGIKSEGEEMIVPQTDVERERDALLKIVADIQETVTEIDQSKVAENGKQSTRQKTKEQAQKKNGQKGKGSKEK